VWLLKTSVNCDYLGLEEVTSDYYAKQKMPVSCVQNITMSQGAENFYEISKCMESEDSSCRMVESCPCHVKMSHKQQLLISILKQFAVLG
jgi:hypothetical protein